MGTLAQRFTIAGYLNAPDAAIVPRGENCGRVEATDFLILDSRLVCPVFRRNPRQ